MPHRSLKHPAAFPATCSPSCGLLQGAIVTMTKALAKDLIAKKGIRVNAVAPGPIWTPIIVESFPEDMVRLPACLVRLACACLALWLAVP